MVLTATSDDATDAAGPGGFTGALMRFPYARLYNLYLDPKEQHNYLTRKLAYVDVFQHGIRSHLDVQIPAEESVGATSKNLIALTATPTPPTRA